jgi:DNA-binding response OmpR family regulator
MGIPRILIVKDDPNVSDMLRSYFQQHGYEVMTTWRGEHALEICRQQPPDLIFLDAYLPDMSGFDVFRNLQELLDAKRTSVIFLVDEDKRHDRIQALELGADDYITKPFDLEELTLKAKNRIYYASASSVKQQRHVPGRRIMIVEDDPGTSNMLRIYFQQQGYEVAVAQRGEDALDIICRQRLCHSIVLDIMLPDMDGYDVCRWLRGNLLTAHIPIIFLTQRDERDDKIHGLQLGADAYITKPFDLEELKLRVQNVHRRADLDPATGLPCSRLVEDQLAYLFFRPLDWALLYIGINGLEPFSAVYGPVARKEVLRFTAMELVQAVNANVTTSDFIGQLGDDDFIIITSKGLLEPLAKDLNRRFDAGLGSHYDWETRVRGYLIVRDDAGNETKVDMMSLSIGVVTADDGPFADVREIMEAAAQARRRSRSSHPLRPGTEANSPCA